VNDGSGAYEKKNDGSGASVVTARTASTFSLKNLTSVSAAVKSSQVVWKNSDKTD